MIGLLTGAETMVVGVEENGDGTVRVYIGARYLRTYVTVLEVDADRVRATWAGRYGHILMPTPPPECIRIEGDALPVLAPRPQPLTDTKDGRCSRCNGHAHRLRGTDLWWHQGATCTRWAYGRHRFVPDLWR